MPLGPGEKCPQCGYRESDPSARMVTHEMNNYCDKDGNQAVFNESLDEFTAEKTGVFWKKVKVKHSGDLKIIESVEEHPPVNVLPNQPSGDVSKLTGMPNLGGLNK